MTKINIKAELKAVQSCRWKNSSLCISLYHCAKKRLKDTDALFIYPYIWVR